MVSLCNNMKVTDGVKAALLMVVVQIVYAGLYILFKIVANDGMNLSIFTAYRFICALTFILPLALFFERESLQQLNWKVLFQAFLCGLFGGTLNQNLFIRSIAFGSTTYPAALYNLIPAVTFIFAISLGMERLNLKTQSGKAKVLGTVTGISGAMILTFYKGPRIHFWSTNFDFMHHVASSHGARSSPVWAIIFSVACCLCYSTWLIIQTKMIEGFAWHYTSTALMLIMGALQSFVFALCTERDWNQWKIIGWNIRLLSIVYGGILASGVAFTLITWSTHKKGPVFVSNFNPLVLLLVAIASSLLLHEPLYFGSVIGGVLIVCGLYMVLWGKGKEAQQKTQLAPLAIEASSSNS